jgi:WD40 repeat protein
MKLVFCLLAAGCGSVVAPSHQGPSPDAGTDTPTSTARCDLGKPFGTPALVPGVNSTEDEVGFALTSNELIAVVDRFTDTTAASWSLLATERASLTAPFDAPSLRDTRDLDAEPGEELPGAPSSDGLALYFARQPAGDTPRLFAATRNVTTTTFADVAITLDGTTAPGYAPSISADGTTLYWVDAADATLHAATRADSPDVFVGQRIVSTVRLGNPVLSADELTLYYTDGAQSDIFVATRTTKNAAFGIGVPVANVNSTANDAPMYLSDDGCVLYLASNRPGGIGGMDIWQAQRPR